ncbi:MAG: response regulator [Oscillospiraceae bacterium]|nr:response regulator [Oscillospiraceae bacterium]
MQKTIFVVDDNDINLASANDALRDHYSVMTLPSAAKMFKLLGKKTPDMILLDIEMPEMDGFEALRLLKEDAAYADIPVIFLTGLIDPSVEVRGFQLGAIDFILKPFSAPALINRLKTHLDIDGLIRERTAQLEERNKQIQQKTIQLQRLQNAIIFGFADLVESRDQVTGGHVERTSKYIKILMDEMESRGIYTDETKDLDIEQFVSSARLHDVGKIAISDTILNKPGKLTDEEYATMKTHTIEGERAIDQIASLTDDDAFLRNARLFAGCHHERWDGKGYPHGLLGRETSIQGRTMALVDVYDALVSERPYKKPFSNEEAIKMIMECAGSQFDPKIAEVFYESREQFAAVKI